MVKESEGREEKKTIPEEQREEWKRKERKIIFKKGIIKELE